MTREELREHCEKQILELLEQDPVLDKIRAEIEQLPTSLEYPDSEYIYKVTKKQLLGIIDKYKTES